MKQESKKKLELIIEKGKESLIHKNETRTFDKLRKITPQEMTFEERFQFIENTLESDCLSFDSLIDIFDLLFKIRDESIANNQASRKLNQIIVNIQKEMN